MLGKLFKTSGSRITQLLKAQINQSHHAVVKSEKPPRIKVKDKMYRCEQSMAKCHYA